MSGLGMIGALGGMGNGTGVGGALMAQGAWLGKQEDADADMARKTKFEQFLMQARNEYAVQAEGRANTESDRRALRDTTAARSQDEYAYGKKVERAPGEREMKVADETASAAGRLDFTTKNIGPLTSNLQAETNAKKTPEERSEASAKSKYWNAYADDVVENGKRAAKDPKIDPALAAQLKEEGDSIRASRKDWEQGVLKGEIVPALDKDKNPITNKDGTPVIGTPAQQQVFKQLAIREQRYQDLVKQASRGGGAGSGGANPINMPSEKAPQPGVVGAFTNDNGDSNEKIAADIAGIKDPQERANAQAAFDSQMRRGKDGKLGMIGVATPPADFSKAPPGSAVRSGAQYVAPATSATSPSATALQPPNTADADTGVDPAMEARRAQESRDINDFKRTDFSPEVKTYREKVALLKSKLEDQRRRAYVERDQRNAKALFPR